MIYHQQRNQATTHFHQHQCIDKLPRMHVVCACTVITFSRQLMFISLWYGRELSLIDLQTTCKPLLYVYTLASSSDCYQTVDSDDAFCYCQHARYNWSFSLAYISPFNFALSQFQSKQNEFFLLIPLNFTKKLRRKKKVLFAALISASEESKAVNTRIIRTAANVRKYIYLYLMDARYPARHTQDQSNERQNASSFPGLLSYQKYIRGMLTSSRVYIDSPLFCRVLLILNW